MSSLEMAIAFAADVHGMSGLELYVAQFLGHVSHTFGCPHVVMENELVAVSVSYELHAGFDNCIWHDRGTRDVIVLIEKNACKEVEVLAGKIADRSQLARLIVMRKAPPLDLISRAVFASRVDVRI